MVQYALVNEKAKINFEKNHQLPYGYSNSIINNSLQEILKVLLNIPMDFRQDYIIERIENGESTVIYPEDKRIYYSECGG